MSVISFEELYDQDKSRAFSVFSLWANDVSQGLFEEALDYDIEQAFTFVSNLRKDVFPCNGGYDKSSPFKRAAYMYVYMQICPPFPGPLPNQFIECLGPIGNYLASLSHAPTALMGFLLVRSCLHKATLKRRDGSEYILANTINVSDHYLFDFVEASRSITPEAHFKTYSILFESLAYQTNPEAGYPKLFKE